MLNIVVRIITGISGLLVIAHYLDQKSSPNFKKTFSDYLLSKADRLSFRSFIADFVNGFTRRVPPYFHLAFFRFSIVLSFLSLLFVVVAQITLYRDQFTDYLFIGNNNDTLASVPYFFLLIGFNLLVDYVSFLETVVVLSFIKRSRGYLELIVLFLADFVLTINIFTLGFAVAVASTTFLVATREVKGLVEISYNAEWHDVDNDELADYPNLKDKRAFSSTLVVFDSNGYEGGVDVLVLSNSQFEKIRVIDIFSALMKNDSKLKNVREVDRTKTVGKESGFELTYPIALEADYRYRPRLTQDEAESLYSSAYAETSTIQSTFPAFLSLTPLFRPIRESFVVFDREEHKNKRFMEDPSAYCLESQADMGKQVHTVSELSDCTEWIVFDSRVVPAIEREYLFWSSFGYIPVSTFFLTSFAITAVVYVAMIIYGFVRMAKGLGIVFSWMERFLDVRSHPFTAASIAASPLFLLLALQ
jgi:hypothetical protein